MIVSLLIDTYHIVRFEFIGYRAIADTRNHGGQTGTLFHEIFCADRVKETLTDGNLAEVDSLLFGFWIHTKFIGKYLLG